MKEEKEGKATKNYVDKSIAETKLYVQQEIKDSKKHINRTFGLIAIIIAIISGLGLIGVSINFIDTIIKDKIEKYSIEKLANEINQNKLNSDLWSSEIKSIRENLKVTEIDLNNISIKSPQLVKLLEDNSERKVIATDRWIQVPFQNTNSSFIEIGVSGESNSFLVIYSYRVKDSTETKKWSGIKISDNKKNSIKFYHADGGFSNKYDYGASGSILVSNLHSGQYFISLEDFSESLKARTFFYERQFAVYRMY